jgi:NAD(P)-dependent dehydrogenase (short-subunit alcohol dehydrogenase family)
MADGIGLAVTEAFLKEGALVAGADIHTEKGEAEAKRLDPSGEKLRFITADVGSTPDMERLVAGALEAFGRIDILVNNAAVAIGGSITEMAEEDWDRVMNTNLKSVYRTIRLVLPHMISRSSGSVINMSSTQAVRSWHNWTAYAAAKGAVMAMTRQLAGQYGPAGIRFNTISPGTILTPMNERRAREEGAEFLSRSAAMHALERVGTPREVAMTAVFLASEESAFITGEDIRVDGGLCVLPRFEEQRHTSY